MIARRKVAALALLALATLTYILYAVYIAAFEPAPVMAADSPQIGAAKLYGDAAVRSLARAWTESALKAAVDGRMHRQEWFLSLADQMPIYQEDLGSAREIESKVEAAPVADRTKGELFDYRAKVTFERGTADLRLLIARLPDGWTIFGLEVKPDEVGGDEPPPPEGPMS